MTYISVAVLVEDAKKAGVEAAVAALTPSYTVGFALKVCADASGVTPQTPPSHWYTNGASVDSEIVSAWQDAVGSAELEDALYGVIIFTVLNHDDFSAWAAVNLGSKGLRFVPPPEA